MSSLPFPVRCLVLALGMCIAALGVALITNAEMGTTPITSLPLVANAIHPLSVGTHTVLFNAPLVVLEKLILGPNFSRANLLQLLPVFFFGFFIDVWMYLSAGIHQLPYIERLLILLAALAFRTHLNFGNLKVMVDAGMVSSAALIGMLCLGHIVGIREGTLLSAILTGFCIRGLGALLHKGFPRLFPARK